VQDAEREAKAKAVAEPPYDGVLEQGSVNSCF
jgi:hypothetical protein